MWKLPPKIKIYEALGAVTEGRVKVSGNEAVVKSSEGNKEYTVVFDPEKNAIMTNDNGSYWQGYLGYPAISFLMVTGRVTYDQMAAEGLKGIPWKKINDRFKSDYEQTKEYALKWAEKAEIDPNRVEEEVNKVMVELTKLKLEKLGKRIKPPNGI